MMTMGKFKRSREENNNDNSVVPSHVPSADDDVNGVLGLYTQYHFLYISVNEQCNLYRNISFQGEKMAIRKSNDDKDGRYVLCLSLIQIVLMGLLMDRDGIWWLWCTSCGTH